MRILVEMADSTVAIKASERTARGFQALLEPMFGSFSSHHSPTEYLMIDVHHEEGECTLI